MILPIIGEAYDNIRCNQYLYGYMYVRICRLITSQARLPIIPGTCLPICENQSSNIVGKIFKKGCLLSNLYSLIFNNMSDEQQPTFNNYYFVLNEQGKNTAQLERQQLEVFITIGYNLKTKASQSTIVLSTLLSFSYANGCFYRKQKINLSQLLQKLTCFPTALPM